MPTLATNKIARFNYQILDDFEAGLELFGSEVKSIKKSQISLKGAYITSINNELWLKNCFVSPYQIKNQNGYDPLRLKKILAKRKEIDSWQGKMKQIGLTLLPLNVYTKGALIKIKIGLARGKKKYDKREAIKKREVNRNIRRALKE